MIKLAEEFEKILGADNGNPPDSLRQMYPKINRNFDRVKDWFNSLLGLINGHIQSNTAHAAEHITYTGDAPGNNAKQAINNTYNRISEIVAQAGDDNTEIVDARGGYTVLGDRLNATDAQLADITQDINGWRIYNNLSQLGISTGTETMTMICAAMDNRSIAVLEKVTSNPATDYPALTGLLIITKFASYRTELRFINGTASNARHWFGYYDVNITPNFTGWFEVPNKNDVPAYEQGTFTPELQFGGASTGITYSTRAGKYTRVGNVIHWAITLDLTSKGTATGNATISGLPYVNYGTPPTTVPATAIGGIAGITLPSNAFGIQATIIGATSQIQLRASSSAVGVTPITDSNFSNGAVIRAEGKYFIA